MNERWDEELSRRRVLLAAATGTATLAGCSGDDAGTPTDDGTLPVAGNASGQDGAANLTSGPNPTPTMTDGTLPAPVKGDSDADVTLAVYEDYACPHCADYNAEGLAEIESAYLESGEIRYEHRDLPIPVADPGSWQAASAAREAQVRQGDDGFWAYAASLFDNHSDLRGDVGPLFERLGNNLGFDGAAIKEAGLNRAHDATVEADRSRGADEANVEGTPGFVVDGEVVTTGFGSSTISTVKDAIDDALDSA